MKEESWTFKFFIILHVCQKILFANNILKLVTHASQNHTK